MSAVKVGFNAQRNGRVKTGYLSRKLCGVTSKFESFNGEVAEEEDVHKVFSI